MSNLIVSFGESSNLCIFGISSFLVLIWLLSRWEFRACIHLHTKLLFIKNGFHMNILLRFCCLRFYRFVFSKRGQTLHLWFLPHMIDYDVYIHNIFVLVSIFQTSPRSYKTESGWETYCGFGLEVLSVVLLSRGLTFPHLVLSSVVGLWCFSAWSCSACDYLRNKPKIIENGVRMKTCLHSRLWKYYRSTSR